MSVFYDHEDDEMFCVACGAHRTTADKRGPDGLCSDCSEDDET